MSKSDDLISAIELRDKFGIDVMSAPKMMQATSAAQFMQQQNEYNQAVRQARARVERNDAAIQRTAQESIEHTRILEKQLQELQAQNEMLKDEAEIARAEIKASKKANKRNRIFSIMATAISIAIAVASLIVAICK